MPEIRERRSSEKPKAKKSDKRIRKPAAHTMQMMRYVQRKKKAEKQDKESRQHTYAVNAAEDAAIDLALDTAERLSSIQRHRHDHTTSGTANPMQSDTAPQGQGAVYPHDPKRLGTHTQPDPAHTQPTRLYTPANNAPSSGAPAPHAPSSSPQVSNTPPSTRPSDTPFLNTASTTAVPGNEVPQAKAAPSGRSTADVPASDRSPGRSRMEPKEKPKYEIKTKASIQKTAPKAGRPEKAVSTSAATSSSSRAVAMGRQRFKKEMQKQTAQQTKQATKAAGELAKKAAAAVANAIKSVATTLITALGGIGFAVLLGVILLIGAVLASPFGILFANEPTADSVSLSSAVAQINMEFAQRLNELQEGEYEEITIVGEPPDWVEVIAIFACKTTSGEDGMDVMTLDAERIDLLRTVFWDMCTITAEEEEPETQPEGETSATEPLPTLHITITAKTADEMRLIYAFTPSQNNSLDALLNEEETLRDMLGDLSISSAEAAELLASLPPELSEERRKIVQQALTLVGKVNYFWGGKSLVIGWDSRWGRLTEVTAAGSETTGTFRPYGLDCSGFADWVFYNVSGGTYILGHGGGVYTQHQYCASISWAQAQPGDLVFYPEDSHIGVVGGWDAAGNIQIIHCASGLNNVVITGRSGFTTVGRPYYYGE